MNENIECLKLLLYYKVDETLECSNGFTASNYLKNLISYEFREDKLNILQNMKQTLL